MSRNVAQASACRVETRLDRVPTSRDAAGECLRHIGSSSLHRLSRKRDELRRSETAIVTAPEKADARRRLAGGMRGVTWRAPAPGASLSTPAMSYGLRRARVAV